MWRYPVQSWANCAHFQQQETKRFQQVRFVNYKSPVSTTTTTTTTTMGSVADLDGKAGGEIMASAERELIMGAFSGVQGQIPW